MKTSPVHAAASARGPFNARVLRAAALLPALSAVALHAADNTSVPDATVTAKRAPQPAPVAAPAPVAPAPAPAAEAKAPEPKPVGSPEVKAVKAAPDADARKLPDTVVVASRSEEKLADVSPSVSKVSGADMRLRGDTSVVSALQGQQGMYLAQSGGYGAQTSVFTRGTGSTSTAFLLDGRKLNAGFSGNYEITRYTTDNLDSIQVNRGASSTLYGANAIGGVVDLRTVDPLAAKANGGSAEVEAGSFGTVIGKVSASGNTDNMESGALAKGIGASIGASVTDTRNDRPNNDFRQVSVLPRVDYRITDSVTADLVMQYSRDRLGLPGSTNGTGAFNPTDYQRDEGFLVSPGLIFTPSDEFKGRIFYSASNLRLSGEQFGAPYLYENDNQEVTAYGEYTPDKHVKFLAGYTYEAQYFHTDSAFATTQSGEIQSNSPWLQVRVYPVEDLTIGAGYRYNDYNLFNGQSTYEGFASYRLRPTGTTFHAKVATAYRAPAPGDFAFGTVGTLSPEESVSYEVGFRQEFLNDKLHFGAVAFDNEIKNLIGFDPVTFATFNVDKARTRGIELSSDWTPEKHVKLFVNADLLEAVSLGSNNTVGYLPGQRLSRRPDWTATAGVEVYPVETVTLGFSTTFVHGREDRVGFPATQVDMGDYILGRVYGKWRVREHVELFGRIENLYDDNYDAAAVNFPALPFGAYAGLRVLF